MTREGRHLVPFVAVFIPAGEPSSRPCSSAQSEIRRRWHRYGEASAHMIAVGRLAAAARSRVKPSRNSAVRMWSAYAAKAGTCHGDGGASYGAPSMPAQRAQPEVVDAPSGKARFQRLARKGGGEGRGLGSRGMRGGGGGRGGAAASLPRRLRERAGANIVFQSSAPMARTRSWHSSSSVRAGPPARRPPRTEPSRSRPR